MSVEETTLNNTVHLAALRRAVEQEQERIKKIITEKQKDIEEHKALIKRLEDLPKKLRHDIMVPFGNVGFMSGKIVKTNEVLQLVGDGYFVERSCFEANECLNRRLKVLNAVIADCEKERKLITDQLNYAEQLFSGQSGANGEVEIMEPFDEEKEAEFRRKRKEKVKTVTATVASTSDKEEDECMKRLAELEMQEEKNGELDDEEVPELKPPPGVSKEEFRRLISRLEEDTSEEEPMSDEEFDEEELSYSPSPQPSASPPIAKRQEDLDSDDTEEEEEKPAIKEVSTKENRRRSVTFAENIEVTHDIRKDEPVTAVKTATEYVSGRKSSILRNKDMKTPCDEAALAAIKAAESRSRVLPGSESAFSGVVVERPVTDYCTSEPSTSTEPARPMSKFKRQRAKN